MKLQISRSISLRSRLLFSLFLGIFAGVLYGWIFGGAYVEDVGFLSDDFLLNYLKKDVNGNQLFTYLLKGRGVSLFFLWILGSSFLGGVLIYLVLAWTGFSVGLYLVAGILKRGIGGVGFCIAALFPQMLFYIPAYGIILLQAYLVLKRQEGGRERAIKYCVVLFVGFLLLFLGVLMESYVNPVIIKKLLKIF